MGYSTYGAFSFDVDGEQITAHNWLVGYNYYGYYSNYLIPVASYAPPSGDIYYGYFTAIEREYNDETLGNIKIIPEISWFNIPESLILIAAHTEEILAPEANEISRKRHHWLVIVDSKDNLPSKVQTTGDRDDLNFLQPLQGVYVRYTQLINNKVDFRYYSTYNKFYYVQDLIRLVDSDTLNQFIINSAIYARDNGSVYAGLGTGILEDLELAFGWLDVRLANSITNPEGESGLDTTPDTIYFEYSRDARWTPGKAGNFERFILGSGELEGLTSEDIVYFVYALNRVIIVEFWKSSELIYSRYLQAQELNNFYYYSDSEFVIGFGYDFDNRKVSLGVKAVSKTNNKSEIIFKEWDLDFRGMSNNNTCNIAGGPVIYNQTSNQENSYRTIWGWIAPIQGRFYDDSYLTKGRLIELEV